jgi:hypothetical protein
MSGVMRWRDTHHLGRAVETAGGQEASEAAVDSMLDEARGRQPQSWRRWDEVADVFASSVDRDWAHDRDLADDSLVDRYDEG